MGDYLVKLSFRAPAHFGEEGADQERSAAWVHSDTLWSALIATWFRYGLDGDQLTRRLPGAGSAEMPPFALSSAFPYLDDQYYLPRPQGLGNAGLSSDPKLLKKTEFLTLPCFVDWLAGRDVDKGTVRHANRVLKEELFQMHLRPRVVLDRVTQRSRIFQSQYTSFGRGAGLWFLVRLHDPELLPLLQAAVAHLGEEGLGGDRSVGAGTFSAQWLSAGDGLWAELLRPGRPGERFCLLSLCNPQTGERDRVLDGCVPAVLERKGWSQSGGRLQCFRAAVRMLAEGSLLGADPVGRVVDVTPEAKRAELPHAIWRSGIALAVPVAAKEEAL